MRNTRKGCRKVVTMLVTVSFVLCLSVPGQPFFLTEQPGLLKKEQNTATLGLVWWFGRKQGTW